MSSLYLLTEANLFCFVIILFLFVLKIKSTLDLSKKIKTSYCFAAVGILVSAIGEFLAVNGAKTICCVACGLLYTAALLLLFVDKVPVVSLIISIVFGVLTYLSFNADINIATYVLTMIFVCTVVLEQLKLIVTDNLTGLYNLYARKLEIEEQERQYKYDHSDSFYVIACDLDKFKTINDSWGHQEGDRALKLVAQTLTKVANRFDAKVFRIGGDEFQIIADTSDESEANKIENAIQEEFDKIKFRDDFDIEISVGKVLYNGEKETEEVLAKADSRLYAEKAKRRNK